MGNTPSDFQLETKECFDDFCLARLESQDRDLHTSKPTVAYHTGMYKPYFVRAEWDADANVWVATSDDVPGLVTEAGTLEALDSKLQVMVPELLEANDCVPENKIIQVELLARRFSTTNLTVA